MKHFLAKSALLLMAICLLTGCLPEPPSVDNSISVVSYDESASSIPKKEESSATVDRVLIDVPVLCQYPDLPTGCEAVAATMVLQYYGMSISAVEFASSLTLSTDFYTWEGKQYGPDPSHAFAGDPFSEYAYGCFAPVIVDAVNRTSPGLFAEQLVNATLHELCENYVSGGKPILVWATTRMREVQQGNAWYLSDGSLFTWPAYEHCYVLLGYDDTSFFFADPQTGTIVGYKKQLAENRFQQLGSQAVYISQR